MQSPRIILATESERKISAMKQLGVRFNTVAANFPEETIDDSDTARLVKTLALEKARTIAKTNTGAIIIGADTLLELDGRVLRKPKDLNEVRKNLKIASGNKILDYTGLAVVYNGKELTTTLTGTAYMRTFGEKEIEKYLLEVNPLDRAGGMGGDSAEGGRFLESYQGEPGQELGLPLNSLKKFLGEFGINI